MDNKKNKRQFIIESAMKIFCRDGFHKAKVSEIALRAGVGKGTIYEYFDSKKHLFAEMMKYYADIYYENLIKTIEDEANIIDKFRKYIYLEAQVITNNGELAHIFMHEAHNVGIEIHKLLETRHRKKIDFIANLIQTGINLGTFREVHPYTAALSFMGSIHHILVSKLFFKDNLSEEIHIENLHELFLNGIKK
ncbi:TetR/AcrR family transcriptional regulator [Marinisporobacter balticus]|uniref:TetR family transcriptional regulator n=1 Tax=Marinisporobacter balticus TaxID=2018667 RepID=A0A4R2KZG1_9FIRM|nr:TetR/AcrR family transcriptional regulator [Marinisporobacter balticus]TCO79514.1 TetR family transcriptional regulator [Marinisporobacter balticus]